MYRRAVHLPLLSVSPLLLVLLSLGLVRQAAAQESEATVGVQGGRFGVGVTSSWPAYGISGTLQLSETLTAEAVLGFFGAVTNFSGRGWYRFNRNTNYDLYGYGTVGVYRYGYNLGTENVLGLGAGAGAEAGLQTLLKDEDLPPVFINAEVGLAFANFRYYRGFSTLIFGAGIHYRFGD